MTMTFLVLFQLFFRVESVFAENSKLNDFEKIIGIVEQTYDDEIVTKYNNPLVVEKMWNISQVVFEANLVKGKPVIYLGGGSLKLPAYTTDIFTIILCHEIGHLIGGEPYKSGHHYKSSVEGQADYFAIGCARKVFQESGITPENNKLSEAKKTEISDFCKEYRPSLSTQSECQHLGEAAYSSLMLGEDVGIDFDFHEKSTLDETLNHRPSQRCQLKTFFAAMVGGPRPGCWFKEN